VSGDRGFSLVELLVALLVIVLLTSVVSFNVGIVGNGPDRAEEVQRLAALMGFAQTEAELSGADHGLYLQRVADDGETRFRGVWLRRYDQGWAAPKDSGDVLEPFLFEAGVELLLTLPDYPDLELSTLDPDLPPRPQVVLFAGGEVTEGELDWLQADTGDLLYRLQWDLFGRMRILPRGEEPDLEDF